MENASLIHHRLYNHRLSQPGFATPAEVVGWLGAVQSQDYGGAKWALAQRMVGADLDNIIEQAFTEGKILRTHVMRPTWHFVTPADIRWLLMLTAPRVHQFNAYMYRQLELDEAIFAQTSAAMTKALANHNYLTREELGEVFAGIGIQAERMRLGYIVHYAELDALICSGPRKGKQFTYALLDERAPDARILTYDEALAELTLRFFRSHGPATVKDFAWWSGLTVAQVKVGLDMVKSQLVYDGEHWFADIAPASSDALTAYLLPNYDEYTIAYKNHDALVQRINAQGIQIQTDSIFNHTLVIDGQILAMWRRTFKKTAVLVELKRLVPLNDAEEQALAAALQRYGDYLVLTPELLS